VFIYFVISLAKLNVLSLFTINCLNFVYIRMFLCTETRLDTCLSKQSSDNEFRPKGVVSVLDLR
jgi:hypothetical protein